MFQQPNSKTSFCVFFYHEDILLSISGDGHGPKLELTHRFIPHLTIVFGNTTCFIHFQIENLKKFHFFLMNQKHFSLQLYFYSCYNQMQTR
jgi:hypothetical protein